MSFQSYADYKATGELLLGEIPQHWLLSRFKQILQERGSRSTTGKETLLSVSAYTGVSRREDVVEEGEFLTRADSLEGYKLCQKNDLVINIMLAWNRALAVTPLDGIVSPAYCVFQVTSPLLNPQFLNYLVRTDQYSLYFKAYSTGVIDSRLRLYPDTFGRLKCWIPPMIEQKAIIAFLDAETSKIDALVAEQRRLIELLKEKRQAVISHAVTKGLNPHVKMKPSGIDWLGDVPEHWEVARVKTLISFLTSGPRGWAEKITEHGALFIQSGDLSDDLSIDFDKSKRVEIVADAESSRTKLQQGDVVVCVTGAKTGNVAICHSISEEAYINQHLCLLRPTNRVIPEFLGTFLKSWAGQCYFELSQYGLKQGLSLGDVNNAPIVRPPISEQSQIVDFVNSRTSVFGDLIEKANASIALLQERRTALISAAVTGKIDVRGFVPKEASA